MLRTKEAQLWLYILDGKSMPFFCHY